MSVMTVDPFEREQARDAALWTGAALLVAALHVGLAVAYLLLKPVPAGQAEAPVFDVAFLPATGAAAPAAPEALPADPTPPVAHSDLAPPQTEPAPPEPAPPTVALQAPEPVQPDQVTVAPPPPKTVEPTPQAKPEKLPERSANKPAAHEKAEREKAAREKAEKEKAEKEKRKLAEQRRAAAPGNRPARLAMAPNAGADSEGARAARSSWESEVAARIRRYATYSANGSAASGTVRVGVTIDRNGRLMSRHLAGSSGSSMLDNAAMAVVARAQPFPHFPPGMNQAQVALIIPLHLRPQ